MQVINITSKCLISKHTGSKPLKPALASRSLSVATSVFFIGFSGMRKCVRQHLYGKAASVGGANGNACGWRGYDKYLLRQTGREGQKERQSAKVEHFNYIWGCVITFLILLTLRSVSVYPPSRWIIIVTVLLLATSWQTWWLLWKEESYLANWRIIQKGNYYSLGQWYTVFSFTMSWQVSQICPSWRKAQVEEQKHPLVKHIQKPAWFTGQWHARVYTTLLICVPRLCVCVCFL